MPTIQKSIGAPASVRGAPLRASSSARAWASASSSVTSASSVMPVVTCASGAPCSTSSTARRSSITWRATRSAEASVAPSACRRWISARRVAASGRPGVSSASRASACG